MHVMIFSNNETAVPQEHIDYTQRLFANNPSLQFKFATPSELESVAMVDNEYDQFQTGANLGPKLAFQQGWFLQQQDEENEDDYYDWVIRINPDVLIRRSFWLRTVMKNPNIHAILVDCQTKRIHTDFFAIRPKELLRQHWPHPEDLPFSHIQVRNKPNQPKQKKENSVIVNNIFFTKIPLWMALALFFVFVFSHNTRLSFDNIISNAVRAVEQTLPRQSNAPSQSRSDSTALLSTPFGRRQQKTALSILAANRALQGPVPSAG